MRSFTKWTLLCAALLPVAGPAAAQEAINFDSALQPGLGETILRFQHRYAEAENERMGMDIKRAMISGTIAHGLRPDLTLMANVSHVFREMTSRSTGMSDSDNGFADARLMAKWRIFKEDTGPTDTARLSLLGGLEIRSGDSTFSSDSYDPVLGAVFTKSVGRHGFDADAVWKFNTGGDADLFRYDAAYVYRLYPATYGPGELKALFGVLELNGFAETNGDNELFLSPGVQFVTGRWALEGTVQLPIWQDIDKRAENDFIVGLGLRLRF